MQIEEKVGKAFAKERRRGAVAAVIPGAEFWAMVRRLNAKVESTDDMRNMWVTVRTPSGTTRIYSDTETKSKRLRWRRTLPR